VRELYQGSKIGINDQSLIQEDYAKAYDAFYQTHHRVSAAEALNKMTKEQIAAMIQTQGKQDKDSYYIEGLSYDVADLDDDADWEIVAQIDGAVHLGKCFIFDKDAGGDYKLITEQDWKVEQWDLAYPLEIDGKKVFKLVTRTGGTGVDVWIMHLFYLDQGSFIEAWQGTLQERSVFKNNWFQKVCGYQVDLHSENQRLYAWETTIQYQLEPDGVTPQGEIKTDTTTKVYLFNGSTFIPE
ncbi:MAG: hypothetical protein PHZ03_10320, partial [Syntrophomonas sp.]|nr:hypothetical protein [Syntrophomonas sp.]